MHVATHDGSFHADEVFAIAALSLLGEPLEVIRTRDRDALAAADLRLDVGFSHDPAAGDFDHHQREGAGERPNGIRFATFGLIWQHYGPRVCGDDAQVAARVDESLVQGVDANDTGQSLTSPLVEGARPMSVSGVIGAVNPAWDETLTPEQERERFDEAVALAIGILRREIASAASAQRAARLVVEAIEQAPDPRVVVLEQNVPFKQVLVPGAPEALFVLYPKRQGWGVEAVPRQLGSFENRLDLPEAWAGLEGAELVAATGVADAVFCHAKRFLAVAGSREGADALAEQALRAAPATAAR
jgi:uncharacterized UPF0160 family protein